MQIKGPFCLSARQEQTALGQGVKAMQRKPGGPLSPDGMSLESEADTSEPSIMGGTGAWSDDATARWLLGELLHEPSGKWCGGDLTAVSIVVSGCAGAQVDDLIYLSAKMRGLVFRAYARRIADLLMSGGKLGEGHPWDRRLN